MFAMPEHSCALKEECFSYQVNSLIDEARRIVFFTNYFPANFVFTLYIDTSNIPRLYHAVTWNDGQGAAGIDKEQLVPAKQILHVLQILFDNQFYAIHTHAHTPKSIHAW